MKIRILLLASLAIAPLAWGQAQPASYLTLDRPVATNEVKIGISVAQSGRAGAIGIDYLRGARVFFDKLNQREGGVHGRKIKLISLDDRFEMLPAVLNTRKLINEERVFTLMNYMGAVGTRAVGLMLSEAQIPLVGAFTGAQSLRQPINRYLFHLRPGFNDETALIVERLITDRSVTKIAVFHQADADGENILRGVERALRPRGTSVAAAGSYLRNTTDVSAAIEIMLNARPDAIVLGSTYQAASLLVNGLKARGFMPIFVGTSFVGADQFLDFAGPGGEGVIFTEVVPLPDTPDGQGPQIVKSFREDMTGSPDFSKSHAALEGYLNAAVVAQALRDATASLNTSAFLKALENMNTEIGGLTVTFTPSTRQGMKDFYLCAIRQGRLVKIDKFNP